MQPVVGGQICRVDGRESNGRVEGVHMCCTGLCCAAAPVGQAGMDK